MDVLVVALSGFSDGARTTTFSWLRCRCGVEFK